ncbi:hypothetical protein GGH96_004303 [Coemansia sp. RSA 1972]|nr:hypothetical protein GGH96_004303 [Coemansia sp. RSA 1972]
MRYLRTDPLLSQLVNMIMRDGKKARAERLVQTALLDIRRHTNTDPQRVLSDAINLACPLMDTKSARQGSKVVQVPSAKSPELAPTLETGDCVDSGFGGLPQ